MVVAAAAVVAAAVVVIVVVAVVAAAAAVDAPALLPAMVTAPIPVTIVTMSAVLGPVMIQMIKVAVPVTVMTQLLILVAKNALLPLSPVLKVIIVKAIQMSIRVSVLAPEKSNMFANLF